MKDKAIAIIKIENKTYSIRATAHALERMQQRNVNEYVVTGNIIALGPEELKRLQESGEEAIIIDEDKNISIVIGFKSNRIYVITVIDKSNVFVKRGTTVKRIA